MQLFLNKTSWKNFLILSAIVVLISSGIIVTMSSPTTAVSTKETVIVRDSKTGAVIFERNGIYYFGYSASNSEEPVTQGEIRPKEILVKYKQPAINGKQLTVQGMDAVHETAARHSGSTQSVNEPFRLAMVKVSHDKDYFQTLQDLKRNPAVEYAEPNYVLRAQTAPNDPYYAQQWGPPMIHAESAWSKVDTAKRAAVTIAILDTGINATHEDLKSSIVTGYNLVSNNSNTNDGFGHGTHVSGIAAALVNNAKGIAGIAGGSKIMPVKVLSDSGSGDLSTIINGIKYATDHGAQVISMSLGGPGNSQAMQDAINYANNHGVSVVAASGNENGTIDTPGNCNGVITVGAIEQSGQRASYSNYGPELDVVAPGTNIISSYIGGPSRYTTMSGTSMATPFVAGVVALVRAANPNLTPSQVTTVIQQSATDKGTPGFDNQYGYGLVDADKAVDLALKGSDNTNPKPNPNPVPSPTPTPTPVPTPTPMPRPIPVVPVMPRPIPVMPRPVPVMPIYNGPRPLPLPLPRSYADLALNKQATASSVEGPGRDASMAFDGNPATRWASQEGVDPQWIAIDLGKVSNIRKITLKWETAYAKAYAVQVSNDGSDWSTVYSTDSGMGGTTSLTGLVSGRYVRMYGTQRGTPYGYSLWDFEIYGD